METRLIVDVACEAGSVGRDQLFNTGKIYSADDKPQHIYPDDSDAVDFRGTPFKGLLEMELTLTRFRIRFQSPAMIKLLLRQRLTKIQNCTSRSNWQMS